MPASSTSGQALLLHGCPVHVRAGAPAVAAVGIAEGRVVAAGELAHVRAALGPAAREHVLDRGALLPAFADPHQHAYLLAVDPYTDVLHRVATDIATLSARVSELAATAAVTAGPWVRLHGYVPLDLAERRSPTAAELDRVYPDRPLHLVSRTYHESVVNSAGLAALGIGRTTPDPPGGRIVRDRRGRATGVLLEAASFAAEQRSRPATDDALWRARLAAHGRRLLSLGITRIGDAAVPVTAADDVVKTLAAVGVVARPLLVGERIDSPAFVAGMTAKVLADGGEYCHFCFTGHQVGRLLSSSARAQFGRDAAMARALGRRSGTPRREPDGHWHSGIRFPAEAGLASVLRRAGEAGADVAVHAVGNGAVEAVVRAVGAGAGRDVGVRVEHAMALDPELARRVGAASLSVAVQPGFLTAFGHQLRIVPLPPPLALMPYRTLLDAGATLSFSSDYPAADLSPWSNLAAAVTRRDQRGVEVHPDQALTLDEAIDAHTRTAAGLLGHTDVGTLEPGMRADLQWCDQDPYRTPIDRLADIRPLAVWSGGVLAHSAPEAAGWVVEG